MNCFALPLSVRYSRLIVGMLLHRGARDTNLSVACLNGAAIGERSDQNQEADQPTPSVQTIARQGARSHSAPATVSMGKT
jgi:hypothetical protein